jgi:hypothetical protein
MHAQDLVHLSEKDRDASYVRASAYIQQLLPVYMLRFALYVHTCSILNLLISMLTVGNADPVYRPKDFYGQLRNIVVINLPVSEELHLTEPSILILAVIQSLKVETAPDAAGALHYKNSPVGIGALEVVDLATIQCSIGRVLDCDSWVIVDRSGPFAQASFDIDS